MDIIHSSPNAFQKKGQYYFMLQNINTNFFDIFYIEKEAQSFNQKDIGINNFNSLREIRKIIKKENFCLKFNTNLKLDNDGLSINAIDQNEKDFKKSFKSFIKELIEIIDNRILKLNKQNKYK